MEKVKIIHGHGSDEITAKVNGWLIGQEGKIQIKEMKHSSSQTFMSTLYSVLIYYDEFPLTIKEN